MSVGWDRDLVPDARGEVPRPEPDCPVEVALAAVGGRWTTLLLRELLHRPQSFSELRTSLPSLSPKVLAERLDEFENRGLVRRDVYVGFPTRSRYSMTPAGNLLRPLLAQLYSTGSALLDAHGA